MKMLKTAEAVHTHTHTHTHTILFIQRETIYSSTFIYHGIRLLDRESILEK